VSFTLASNRREKVSSLWKRSLWYTECGTRVLPPGAQAQPASAADASSVIVMPVLPRAPMDATDYRCRPRVPYNLPPCIKPFERPRP